MPTTLNAACVADHRRTPRARELHAEDHDVVALVFTPLVLLYQAWTYWVFRKRLGTQHIPAPSEPAAPCDH